jgi:hypothetical protein
MTINAELAEWVAGPPRRSSPPTSAAAAAAVGVGGQSVWLAANRRALSAELLENNPGDVDALKGMAISLIEESKSAGPNSNGLLMDAISYARSDFHIYSHPNGITC